MKILKCLAIILMTCFAEEIVNGQTQLCRWISFVCKDFMSHIFKMLIKVKNVNMKLVYIFNVLKRYEVLNHYFCLVEWHFGIFKIEM